MNTYKLVFVLVVLFAFSGCATTMSPYSNIYNDAVAAGKSVIIIKKGDFKDIEANVNEQLKVVGYDKVLTSSPQEGFMVLVKNIPLGKAMLIGDTHPYKIIFKYTKAEAGKTRIDLVNGSPGLFTKNEVAQDIGRLSALIAGDGG